MFKRILALCFSLVFSFLCFLPNANAAVTASNQLSGKYPVQQASIDDSDGEYTLMLLNTPAGTSPVLKTNDLQMARLTDEEVSEGEETYVEIKGNNAVMHLSEDFRIEYVHNETQVVENPNTGRQETVVVRRESNFWTPFAGMIAGQAIGNMLFAPRYYMPPAYSSGRTLTGVGGYGNTYNQAARSYRSSHNEPHSIEKNRRTFRSTGSLKSNSRGLNKSARGGMKATGSGFGSSNLRTNGNSNRMRQSARGNSFGTGSSNFRRRAPMRRSFGRRR